jgi:hypothetical protein
MSETHQPHRSRPAAILSDAHFWIPIVVLVFGLIILAKLS